MLLCIHIMSRNIGYLQYVVEDLLGEVPGLTWKPMFSGFGIYKDGIIFCLLLDDHVYFKVSDLNRADYEAYGSKPFSYEGKRGKVVITSYYTVPEEILENKADIQEWVEKAVMACKLRKSV